MIDGFVRFLHLCRLLNQYSGKPGGLLSAGSFSTTTIGWMAIATGVSAIFAVIFLILMYTVTRALGTFNDFLNILIGISSVILAWMLYTEFQSKLPLISQIALALALVGAVFAIIGSVLVISGRTDFVLAGWYSGVGNALIGLWLVTFCCLTISSDVFPRSLAIFGIIAGAIMAIGLVGIPGMIAKIDSMESLPWYLYIAFFGWLGTYVLFPIWTFWLGRYLLNIK